MKLIPFNKDYAELIMNWQFDNTPFFRINRYMTLEECANLPDYVGEVLMIKDKDIIGCVYIKDGGDGVCEINILLDPEKQKKGRGAWAMKLVEDYVFNIRNFRKIMFYIFKEHGFCKVLESLGFKTAGIIKSHVFVNGTYKDLFIYEKLRGEYGA